MPLTREEIKSAAMALDPAERELLAEELMLSLSEADREAVEQAWLAEVRRRDAAFERGETGTKPVQEVIDRLMRRARP